MRIDLDQTLWTAHIKSAFMCKQMTQFDPKATVDTPGRPEERINQTSGAVEHRYEIHCNWVDEDAGFAQPENFTVRVWSTTPVVVPDGLSPVAFGGLVMNVQDRTSGDGKGFTRSFSAESFTFESAPSTKRATATSAPSSKAEANGKEAAAAK